MAGYVIHNICGERFLNIWERMFNFKLSEEDRTKFLMGNLIVDSSRIKWPENPTAEKKAELRRLGQEEKKATHFRGADDANLCIQVPIIEKFTEKYDELITMDISALGYLFHLYTDKIFFENLFPQAFETLDKNMNKTIYESENTQMLIWKKFNSIKEKLNNDEEVTLKKSDIVFDKNTFWSAEGMYDEYTIMNKILLEHYNYNFDIVGLIDKKGVFVNPGIEEVDFNNIESILKDTSYYINESYDEKNKDKELKIFSEENVIKFIEYVGESFMEKFSNYMEHYASIYGADNKQKTLTM